MSPPGRDQDLISRYFDQALSPAEEQELAHLLQRSADARALLRDLARVEGLTAHLVGSGVLAAIPPRARPRPVRPAARAPRSMRFNRAVVLAAAALVAVGSILLLEQLHRRAGVPMAQEHVAAAALPTTSNLPHIVSCGREDHVSLDHASVMAAAGMALGQDSTVSATGTLTLAWNDGTQVVLHAGSQLAISGGPDAKEVILRVGVLDAEIAPQPAGHPMLFRTARAICEVVGTGLSLSTSQAGDRLDVHHGLVRFRTASSALDVTAGASAVGADAGAAVLLPGTPTGGARFTVQRPDELARSIALLHDHDTLQLAPGTYQLAAPLVFDHLRGVTLCGEADQAATTILQADHVGTAIDLLAVSDFTIAMLTIADAHDHLIFCHGEAHCEGPRLMDLILSGARENFIRAIGADAGSTVDHGLVSGCRFSCRQLLDAAGFVAYLDISGGKDWIIRGCTFEPMRFPIAEHNPTASAVLARGGASGTVCERNRFSGCLRGITYGVQPSSAGAGHDHQGGIIRDNLISRAADEPGDCGIALDDSPLTQVLGNTVLLHGSYPFAIECRYPGCAQVILADNLADAGIALRDGSSGSQVANLVNAQPEWFVDAMHGDVHLTPLGVGQASSGRRFEDLGADLDGHERSATAPVLIGAEGAAR